MKKYITIAALLVAGNVFVNAAEQTINLADTGYTTGVVLTTTLTAEQLTNIVVTPNVNKTLIGFGVALDNNTTHSAALTVKTWDSKNEFHLYYNQDAGVDASGFGYASASFSAPEGYTCPAGHAINNAFDYSQVKEAALTLAFAPKAAATDVYGISLALTVEYNDGTWASIVGTATGYSWSNNQYKATEVFYDDSLLSAPVVTLDGSWTHESLVEANKQALAIPEPSAFGLLAGLGALALVGTRRRRK